jgi:hypothetical protein
MKFTAWNGVWISRIAALVCIAIAVMAWDPAGCRSPGCAIPLIAGTLAAGLFILSLFFLSRSAAA